MLSQILSGWKNFLDKSEVMEAVAQKRAAICAACPNSRSGKLLAFIKDELTDIQGAYCSICSCPLSAKVRSNDICPENKW